MFSYLPSPVSSHWRFLVFAPAKDHESALTGVIQSERADWLPRAHSTDSSEPSSSGQSQENTHSREISDVLSSNDLYYILGVPRAPALDRLTLRRAYLSRSRACHPDKCPGNPDATHAFQRISIAYGVLSQPSLRRLYDARPSDDQSDFLRAHPHGYADETLRGVLLSIVADYLDGNLEMIRTFLQAVSDLNPSLKLSDDNINSVLSVLESIRGRVLTCRACLVALHAELIRVLELQYAFRHLPYLDFTGRSRLTIQLIRITLSLPVTLEKAVQEAWKEDAWADKQRSTADDRDSESDKAALLPKHVILLIRGIDVILDRMERVLG